MFFVWQVVSSSEAKSWKHDVVSQLLQADTDTGHAFDSPSRFRSEVIARIARHPLRDILRQHQPVPDLPVVRCWCPFQ